MCVTRAVNHERSRTSRGPSRARLSTARRRTSPETVHGATSHSCRRARITRCRVVRKAMDTFEIGESRRVVISRFEHHTDRPILGATVIAGREIEDAQSRWRGDAHRRKAVRVGNTFARRGGHRVTGYGHGLAGFELIGARSPVRTASSCRRSSTPRRVADQVKGFEP